MDKGDSEIQVFLHQFKYFTKKIQLKYFDYVADNWQLETIEKGAYWKRGAPIRIKHVIEGTYLASSTVTFPKPIAGQQEVKAVSKKKDSLVLWRTEEGIYFEADLNKISN